MVRGPGPGGPKTLGSRANLWGAHISSFIPLDLKRSEPTRDLPKNIDNGFCGMVYGYTSGGERRARQNAEIDNRA